MGLFKAFILLFSISGSKVSDLVFEEFNGVLGKSSFNASPKLTERIAAQLVKPIMFNYVGGHVSDIRTSAEIPDIIVNIVRGILDLFQVTVKTTQNIYELEEVTHCWQINYSLRLSISAKVIKEENILMIGFIYPLLVG